MTETIKPKILGIQFRENQNSVTQEQACINREIDESAAVSYLSALDESVAWNDPRTIMDGYDGVVLGGSGEFDFDGNRSDDDPVKQTSRDFLERLRAVFLYIFEHDIPTLGICYGHQILGAFAGAQVQYSATEKKSRSHEVKLLVDKNEHFLFVDLPDSFQAHYGHKDVLSRVPEGAKLLMNGGDQCKVSALQYKKNIYTTQFHPELNFGDMVERIQNSPGYLPEGVLAEEVFSDDPDSNKILQNFGKFVAQHANVTKETAQV